MWARITPGNVIELIAQDKDDEESIKHMHKIGHLHFCCKSITTRRKKKVLELTASIIKWKRPRGE